MTDVQPLEMKIVVAPPPNFAAVKLVFPECVKPGVMFCYGDTIYNPSGVYVQPHLLAHEAIHSARQTVNYWQAADGREFPNWSPEEWWDRYLKEPQFRFSEELFAHVAEYRYLRDSTKSRATRREYLRVVAERLASPLYGSTVSMPEAMREIEHRLIDFDKRGGKP